MVEALVPVLEVAHIYRKKKKEEERLWSPKRLAHNGKEREVHC